MTGGAGFIGSNIVDELVAQGHEVRVLDNLSTGSRHNLDHIASDITLIEGDIRSHETLKRACEGVDRIVHEAALPSVPRSIADPLTSHEVNVTGTLNMLVAARDAGVKRVVFAGSSSAYGDNKELPKHELLLPMPMAPYAAAKLAGENYCRVFCRVYGLETVVVRYFNVFGPRQNPDSEYSAVIPKFIRLMIAGKQPTVFGDGQNSRDFTYIENVVKGTVAAASTDGVAGEVFNIACGDRYSLTDLVDTLNEIIGSQIEPLFEPDRKGDVPHSMASIKKAQSQLGFTPTVGFQEGLRRTVEWMRGHTGW